MDWRHLAEILDAGGEVYSELKNVVVWAKSNAGQGSFTARSMNFILVFKNGDAPHQNNVELGRHGRNRSNVWTYAVRKYLSSWPSRRIGGPSDRQTRRACRGRDARPAPRRGEIVLDPFMGSGTTILAAEKVGRRAYGLEN